MGERILPPGRVPRLRARGALATVPPAERALLIGLRDSAHRPLPLDALLGFLRAFGAGLGHVLASGTIGTERRDKEDIASEAGAQPRGKACG